MKFPTNQAVERQMKIFTKILTTLFLCSWTLASTGAELPAGFGGIRVGDAWLDLRDQFKFRNMVALTTPWDRQVNECGYRSVLLATENGELLVTVNDFVVTDVSYVTPIKPGSDLLQVADVVMENYGQPDRASMRDAVGKVTIDRDRVNYITLSYSDPRPVRFMLSGAELWRYQITVDFPHRRWHENKTARCAREKASQVKAEAATEPAASTEKNKGTSD